MNVKYPVLFGCLVATLFSSTVGSVAAGGDKSAGKKLGEDPPLGAILDQAPSEKDQGNFKAVQAVLEKPARPDGEKLLDKPTVVFLSHQEALLRAIKKNLNLASSRLDTEKALAALQQADAVFDPVFSLSLGQSVTQTYYRAHWAKVAYKTFNNQPVIHGQRGVTLIDPRETGPQVDEIVYGVQKGKTVYEDVAASSIPVGAPSVTGTGKLAISQNLPWGGQLALTETTTRSRSYDSVGGIYWEHPWGTSLAANLTVPLPLTKGFGPNAKREIDIKQAKIAQKRVDWAIKGTLNDTLRNVGLAYWDMVRKLEYLLAAIDNRRVAEERAQTSERLLKAGNVTQYAEGQMQAELARAKVQEEKQRLQLVTASIALGEWIEDNVAQSQNTLFFPVGFHDQLAKSTEVNLDQAVATAKERNPALKMSVSDLESARLNVAYMHNQARVDLAYSGSLGVKQDNSKYGYGSYWDSQRNLDDVDSNSQGHSLAFSRAWKNRAADANAASADISADMTQLSGQNVEDGVIKQVLDAYSELGSARSRVASAQKNEELAQAAYERGKRRWEVRGDVTALELILKLRDKYQAQLTKLDAMVSVKQAETKFRAAQGILPEAMAIESTANGFDRSRVGLLASNGLIPYFSGAEKSKDGSAL